MTLSFGPVSVFILFLILKLVGVIAWSWLWVTVPLWGSAALAIALGGGIFLGYKVLHRTVFSKK